MDANTMFVTGFHQTILIGTLLYAGCFGAFALLGVSAAAMRRRGRLGAR